MVKMTMEKVIMDNLVTINVDMVLDNLENLDIPCNIVYHLNQLKKNHLLVHSVLQFVVV